MQFNALIKKKKSFTLLVCFPPDPSRSGWLATVSPGVGEVRVRGEGEVPPLGWVRDLAPPPGSAIVFRRNSFCICFSSRAWVLTIDKKVHTYLLG